MCKFAETLVNILLKFSITVKNLLGIWAFFRLMRMPTNKPRQEVLLENIQVLKGVRNIYNIANPYTLEINKHYVVVSVGDFYFG